MTYLKKALMGPEAWESFVKLPHDDTWTMEQVSSDLCVHGNTSVGWHLPAAPKLSVGVHSIRSPDWGVRVALMVPEAWESVVKLPHDTTWTMDQVSSELCVHGSTESKLIFYS